MDISVVVPLYNEAESLPELCDWIRKVMDEHRFSYEVLLMDDGSDDGSWEVIQDICAKNNNIKGVRFRRNYGKSAALNVGFQEASGDVVITMDADLQDSPDEIPELYRRIYDENLHLISGWKQKRYDPISKTIPTKLFNYATRSMSGIHLHDFNCGLKAYRKEVVKAIEVYGEMHRYIPVIAKWAGFKRIGEQVVQHRARKYGSTKFGWERFINGFLDLLTIFFVSRFGKKPMHFFGTMGALSFLLGFIMTCWEVGQKVYKSAMGIATRDVTTKPLFYLSLTALVIGVLLFLAGFLGELIARSSTDRNQYGITGKIGLE